MEGVSDIPFTEDLWSKVAASFDFPENILREGHRHQKIAEFEAFDEGFGILISYFPFGVLSLTHNPTTDATYAVGVDIQGRYIPRIMDCLYQFRAARPLHLNLLAAWLGAVSQSFSLANDRNLTRLKDIPEEMHTYDRVNRNRVKEIKEVDFDWLIGELRIISSSLIFEQWRADMHLDLVNQILQKDSDQTHSGSFRGPCASMSRCLRIRLSQIRDALINLERMRNGTNRMVSIHWQTVHCICNPSVRGTIDLTRLGLQPHLATG